MQRDLHAHLDRVKKIVFIISLANNEKRTKETGETCNQNYEEIIMKAQIMTVMQILITI